MEDGGWSVVGGAGAQDFRILKNETLMTGFRSPPLMKICEMVGQGGRRRPEWLMERLNRKRNWPGRHVESPNGAVEPRKKIILKMLAVLPPDERRTKDDLCSYRTMRRKRRGEKGSGGLHHDRASGRRAARGATALRYLHGGFGVAARLAERGRHHACGDGVHRFLLETCIQRAGGEPEGVPRQSAGSEEPQGPQDGR